MKKANYPDDFPEEKDLDFYFRTTTELNGKRKWFVLIVFAIIGIVAILLLIASLSGCARDVGFLPASGNKMTIGDIGDKIDRVGGDLNKNTADIKEQINEVSISQKALVASNKTEYGSGKYLYYAIAVIGFLVLVGYLAPILANKLQLKSMAKNGIIEQRKK